MACNSRQQCSATFIRNQLDNHHLQICRLGLNQVLVKLVADVSDMLQWLRPAPHPQASHLRQFLKVSLTYQSHFLLWVHAFFSPFSVFFLEPRTIFLRQFLPPLFQVVDCVLPGDPPCHVAHFALCSHEREVMDIWGLASLQKCLVQLIKSMGGQAVRVVSE